MMIKTTTEVVMIITVMTCLLQLAVGFETDVM